jgi:hypothetical protein
LLVVGPLILDLQLCDGIASAAPEFELIVDLQHPLDGLQPFLRKIGLCPFGPALHIGADAPGCNRRELADEIGACGLVELASSRSRRQRRENGRQRGAQFSSLAAHRGSLSLIADFYGVD